MIEGARHTAVTTSIEDAGERVDRLLAARLDQLSRSRVKALIEEGRVTADGATITNPSFRVKPGQIFTLNIPAPIDDRPEAQPMALKILYEDAELVVLDKPAGLVVHPAPGNPDRTLVNALLAHCGDTLQGIGGVKRPGIVHRIDKETSGLMVVAKTGHAHAALSAGFAERSIERAYWAAVWGTPNPRDGEIKQPIGRSPINRKKMAVVASGKPAHTLYRTLRPLGPVASLVECRLKTGRTHQIRVHMTELGHPLIGDPV
jgi:23S rRNA pseudouridine1911/1915/1917 synthase